MSFAVKSRISSDMLLEIQAILPEISPFLSAEMAVLSNFFQMFIALGMYNFESVIKMHLKLVWNVLLIDHNQARNWVEM